MLLLKQMPQVARDAAGCVRILRGIQHRCEAEGVPACRRALSNGVVTKVGARCTRLLQLCPRPSHPGFGAGGFALALATRRQRCGCRSAFAAAPTVHAQACRNRHSTHRTRRCGTRDVGGAVYRNRHARASRHRGHPNAGEGPLEVWTGPCAPLT